MGNLFADEEHLFMVPEIEITIPAASLAKNPFPQSVKLGQRIAYEKLLKKITSNPKISGIDNPSDVEIGSLISKVDVEKEQRTKAAYKASLNYYFVPQKVKDFLGQKGALIQEQASSRNIILPVLKTGSIARLWEESNAWKNVWANYPYKDRIRFPFIVPYGDFDDMGMVSTQEVLEGKKEVLEKIAQKYGCQDCIVAIASLEEDQVGNKAKLEISTHYYGNQGYSNIHLVLEDQPKHTILQTGFREVLNQIDTNWKPKLPEEPLPEHEIEVKIALSGPRDYDLVEAELKQLPFIKALTLLTLTTEEAFLRLKYQEQEQKLKDELSKRNLILENLDGKFELRWKPNYAPA